MELLDIRVAPSITTVASFFTPGAAPYASLVEDSSGNLFGTTSTGGTSGGNGTVFEVPYSNSSHSYGSLAVLASFNGTNGAYPHAGLFEDSGGNLFGTTEYGGSSADGTVFELLYNSAKQSYGSLTTLANFNSTNGSNPIGGLTEDGSGNLFGTTEYGGSFGKGIVFEIPYNSSTHAYGSLSTLASFNGTNGANPYAGLVEDGSGNLFGTTEYGGSSVEGTVFELPYNSSTLSYGSVISLVNFNSNNGAHPYAALVEDSGGNLFGTSSNGGTVSGGQGTVFEVPFDRNTHSYGSVIILVNFNGTNGYDPYAGLVEDSSGNLFGTTSSGTSTNNQGTVFEVPYDGNAHTYASVITLVSFNGTNGLSPEAGLVEDSSGSLFGTTAGGGKSGYGGTVFEVPYNSSTQTYGSLITFVDFNGENGVFPQAGLVEDSSGNLFGTTTRGGTPGGYGTVFEVPYNRNTQTYGLLSSLVSFNGTNGATPIGGLIEDSNGNLFGTTAGGGSSGYGTVFEVPFNNSTQNYGSLTTLGNFNGTNGADPVSALVEDSSGNLFGTTELDGRYGNGTVFEVPYNSGTHSYGSLTTVAEFIGFGGSLPDPTGALVEDSSGNLFGTTGQGGTALYGTVFELPYNKNTQSFGSFIILVNFNRPTGITPLGGLVEDSSGNLFGTTEGGGTSGYGTVFEVPYNSNTQAYGSLITLVSFSGNNGNGANPYAGVIEDSSGNLFGTTLSGGTFGHGTVFEVPYNRQTQTYGSVFTLVNFNGTQWSRQDGPYAGLVEDSSGNLYGTTIGGGTSGFGAVFVLSALNSPIQFKSTGLSNWTVNVSGYTQTIMATGGAGSLLFSTTGTLPAGLTLSSSGVLSGTPTQAGSYTFAVTATDALGASASQTYTVTIKAPPVLTSYQVTIGGSTPFQAGAGLLVTVQALDQYGNPLTSYNGPTTLAATLTPPVAASNFPITVSINGFGQGFSLANLQKAGSYTITVADGSGSFTGASPVFTVLPGPAAKLAFVAQPVSTPTGNALPPVTVQVEDVYDNVITIDNSDRVTIGIGSGPGAFTSGSTVAAMVHNGVAAFNNLVLVTPGSYQLRVVVPGLYTGPDSTVFIVLPLQVVPGSFVGMPSGFSLQLNGPILVDSLTPALYGSGAGPGATVTPTVTLTQLSGTPPAGTTLPYQVPGSLVVSPTSQTLTFLETATASVVNNGTPLLPDGVYVARIGGNGLNGLQALNPGGGYLDGTYAGTPGQDFTATFTVGAAAAGDAVVWLPDTADGPGQALSAPGANRGGGPYPVYLDSRGDVTAVQATLDYNPALLTVTPSTTATFTVTVPTPGTAVIQYNGPPLAAGVQTPIGFLTAAVPRGTAGSPVPYKAENVLHLANVTLNGASAGVTTCDGLHLVAYVGDADGNGMYSSADALLITRVVLQSDTGFTAYPLVDPVVVADTDGSGFIPADAPLQVNEAGVGVPTANLAIPPIPSGVHFMAVTEHVHPSARIVTGAIARDVQTTKGTKDTKQTSSEAQALLDAALVDPWLDLAVITNRRTIPTLRR